MAISAAAREAGDPKVAAVHGSWQCCRKAANPGISCLPSLDFTGAAPSCHREFVTWLALKSGCPGGDGLLVMWCCVWSAGPLDAKDTACS